MKEASYSSPLSEGKVRCELCPHHCLLTEGKRGICLTRKNENGKLVSLNYCRPVSTAIDPIEKKPLYHFRPGSHILSMGPNGCTFKCSFCQNCEISQGIVKAQEYSLQQLTNAILQSDSIGVAYTYSEPYIWFETIMDIGRKIHEAGLENVMVTNGYMNPSPLAELLTVVDAMNIDIKSMNPAFYTKLCKGQLEPVLQTCQTVKKHAHLEITNLLITGENDSMGEIQQLTNFIATYLGKDTPLHLSRYFPRFKMNVHATSQEKLLDAYGIAKSKLDHVYIGNAYAGDKENTYCPSCGALLIGRKGYKTIVTENLAKKDTETGMCTKCNTAANIVM